MVFDAVRSIRNIREKYQLPLNRPLSVTITPSGADLPHLNEDPIAFVLREKHLVEQLGGIKKLALGHDLNRPPLSSSAVVGPLQLYVELGDVVDLAAERTRLTRVLDNKRKMLDATRRKLDNSDFVEKAPSHVVATERERSGSLSAEITALERDLLEIS